GTTRGLAIWDGATIAGAVPDLGTPSPFIEGNNNINGIAFTGDTIFVSSPRGVQLARLSERIGHWTFINNNLPVDRPAPPATFLNVSGPACDGHNLFATASGARNDTTHANIQTSFRWNPADSSWHSDFPANPQVRRMRDDFGVILATVVSDPQKP